METKYGALYIAIEPADEYSYRDTERGNVIELRPQLRVCTAPEFEADAVAEHWTIRGRAYTIHDFMIFDARRDGRWHRLRSPYMGGFRNDRRGPVEFRTATFDLMRDTVVTALDEFAARHPGWEDVSRYLLHSNKATGAELAAMEARREAERYDAEAAEFRTRAEPFAAALSKSGISLTG
jgi:hypothetical protein